MGTIALVGGTLVDGTGAAPVPNATIVAIDGRITAVGRAAVPPGATRYDATGLHVLPGLIDGHVHLDSNASDAKRDIHLWSVTTFREEQAFHAAANARTAIEAGFTTVRDTAGDRLQISLKHAEDDFVLDGARVIAAGFVGMTGGHGDLFCPPAVDKRPYETADGADECRKLVRRYARDGADLVKICTSGGVLSIGDESEWRNYTLEETQVIVDEAHALGKRVAAHAHTRAGIAQALEAGVDTLEHGSSLDEALADRMKKQGTFFCATLAIHEQIQLHGRERGVPAASLAKAAALHEGRLRSVRLAKTAGIPIFTGTDSSSVLPFGNHAWELELLCRDAGMSAMDAIIAATKTAAAALGIDGKTGTLVSGKLADVLVVEGDVLADITLLRQRERIRGVFREGRLLVDRGLRRIGGA